MEKRINLKTREYLQTFKGEIKDTIVELFPDEVTNPQSKIQQLLQFVYDYQPLTFSKEDFQKRKRIKNIVPFYDRCCALRSNKEQCTRRK